MHDACRIAVTRCDGTSPDLSVAFWFASPVGRARQSIDEKKLSNWKLLDDFRRRLAKVAKTAASKPRRPAGPERKLPQEDYFSLMLSGLFNPVPTSMRGLRGASHLERVQKDVCGREVSLGSFSEARAVFYPELPKRFFLDLSAEIPVSWGDARLRHRAAKLHLKISILRQSAFFRGCDPVVQYHAGSDDMPVSRGDFIRQKVGMAPEVMN